MIKTKGVIVDLETTGLNPEEDKIIEVGVLAFDYLPESQETHITTMYSGLQDPGFSLPAEIIKVTGLTDAALAGKSIDWKQVSNLMDPEALFIAHNMNFDKGFLEHQSPIDVAPLQWACSVRHIDWYEKGFRSKALNYLAADHGFVNPFAHRALFDCATTFRLIAPHFAEITKRCQEKEFKIYAKHSPFEKKDLLKARHYRWDPKLSVWCKHLSESKLESERVFLSEQIYDGAPRHVEEPLS